MGKGKKENKRIKDKKNLLQCIPHILEFDAEEDHVDLRSNSRYCM